MIHSSQVIYRHLTILLSSFELQKHSSMNFNQTIRFAFCTIICTPFSLAQIVEPASTSGGTALIAGTSDSAAELPGDGLRQHDFLYAGEDKHRRVFIIRQGQVQWSFEAPDSKGEISDAVMLSNGNVLITSRAGVHEVTHAGDTVFALTPADLPDYKLHNLQLAWRLPNGNTVLNNWVNAWGQAAELAKGEAVQALEVTPDKQVVWALRSWYNPNLGPATTLQFLDQPAHPENVSFGDIR